MASSDKPEGNFIQSDIKFSLITVKQYPHKPDTIWEGFLRKHLQKGK